MNKHTDTKAEATKTSTKQKPLSAVKPPRRPKPPAPTKPPESKIAKVIVMMRKPGGATIKAIMDATNWQAHSVRGAIAGAIKKKMGLKVISETRGDERVYRIGG